MTSDTDKKENEENSVTRRDFIVTTATAVACAGAVTAGVPFLQFLSPDQGVLAVGATEVDISNIKEGETATVMFRGQPVFVRHRTAEEIKIAQETNLKDLRDPQKDEERVHKGKEKWLITMAICTHLGCVPLANKGEYKGWLCPCHGSHYDTSGRIRKGPAPLNLPVPPYEFLSETMVKIG